MASASTRERRVAPELMDVPGLDPAAHAAALAGLRRINAWSGTVRQMARPLLAVARHGGLTKLTLLDIACGGGDVPVGVAQTMAQHGIEVELMLVDASATALRVAQALARQAGIPCQTVQADALGPLPVPAADAVTSSLYLHHVAARRDAVSLLRQMAACARRIVVVSDLQRSRVGLALAWTACRVLSRSAIVHHDGPASVRAAWTCEELADLAAEAQLRGAQVRPAWPWRLLLVWQRAEAAHDPH